MATSVQSQSSASTSPTEVWRNLERNHIHDNDPHGAELGADIIAGAETVINGFRNSTTTAEEQQDIKLTVRSYKKATKLSFLVTLWSVLLNMDRQVKQNLTDEEWVTRAWVKDGLRATWQERFNSKTVHQLDFHLDGWPEWNKVPKVKTPYPDITYGYHHESCTQAMRSVESGFAANMCKDVAFPWFVVEAKSANEPIEAAEMQCARAGAAIVYQLRKLFNDMQIESAKHEQPTSSPPPSSEPHKFPYADPSAIAFTLAVAPSKAHLSVHFVEQHTATQPHYHMHLIGSYDFNRPAAYKDLRKHINNIFDWGLKERKQDIEKRCEEYSKIVRLSKMKRKADS